MRVMRQSGARTHVEPRASASGRTATGSRPGRTSPTCGATLASLYFQFRGNPQIRALVEAAFAGEPTLTMGRLIEAGRANDPFLSGMTQTPAQSVVARSSR
jgi:hypothetical protein